MLRKTLLTLSTGAMLGAAVIAPNAALAQLPPPPGGPPPGLTGGGPAGLPRPGRPPGLGAAGLPRPPGVGRSRSGLDGGQGNVYGRSGYAYGDGSWRDRYWAPCGVSVYSNSNSSGCYYTYNYSYRLGAYRRVQVCSEE